MKKSGYHVLRVGLAITFFWIGILILRNPEAWGAMLQPWAAQFIPGSIKSVMMTTAVFDIVVGFFLLIDVFAWFFALLASVHLIVVLATTGINAITVRDIGLLAASLAIMVSTLPEKWFKKR